MAQCVTGRDRSGAYQLIVVALVLVVSVAWLVIYTTVVNASSMPGPLTPELAARLAFEYDQELKQIELQMLEIHGGQMPPAAGS